MFEFAMVNEPSIFELLRFDFYDKTNVTYELIGAQWKKNCNGGTALERLVGRLLGLKPVLSSRNLTLNLDAAWSWSLSVTSRHLWLWLYLDIFYTF